MALYPTWGCGQKISVRDWTVTPTGDNFVIHVFKDGKYRFGGYRSMDVLRLWAMDGMDKAVGAFYRDISSAIDGDREVRFRKRLFDELTQILSKLSSQNHVKILFRKSIDDELRSNYASVSGAPTPKRRRRGITSSADFLASGDQYRLFRYENYEPVPAPQESDPVDDTWHELSPINGDNGAGAFYDTLVYDQLSQSDARLEPTALHQGFNDRSGVRRWMLDGGLRFERLRRDSEGSNMFENFGEMVSDFETMQHSVTPATLQSDFVDVIRVAAAAVFSPPPNHTRPHCVFQASGYDFSGEDDVFKGVQLFDVTYDRNGRPSHLGPMQAQFAFDEDDESEVERARDGLRFRTHDTKKHDFGCGFGICATIGEKMNKFFGYLPIDFDVARLEANIFNFIVHVIIPLNDPQQIGGEQCYSRSDDPALNFMLFSNTENRVTTRQLKTEPEYELLSQIAMKSSNGDIYAVGTRPNEINIENLDVDLITEFVNNPDKRKSISKIRSILFQKAVYPVHFLNVKSKVNVISEFMTMGNFLVQENPEHLKLVTMPNLVWFKKARGSLDWERVCPFVRNDHTHDYTSTETWRSAFNIELYNDACVASDRDSWPRSHDGFSSLMLQPLPFVVDDELTKDFLGKVKTAAVTKAKALFETCFELVPHEMTPPGIPLLLDGKTVEFYAAGDGLEHGWSIGGTPMALIDGLELGVGFVNQL
jgi:hypothetical protein